MAEMGSFETVLPLRAASEREISAAYRHCAGIAKRAAGNFHYAFLLLPRVQRQAIQALYAFCRAGDDAADDDQSLTDSKDSLALIRKRLDLCYQGLYCDMMTLALADAVQRFKFDREHFDDMLLGIESDLAPTRYATQADLSLYCYRVASTVGLLCLKIFGADTERARSYAVNLGIGMQLTNILRDLQEDWERGRLYIPEEDLTDFDLNREILFDAAGEERLGRLILSLASRARDHFTKARNVMPPELGRKLIAAKAMGAIYEAILTRIEQHPVNPNRVELSRSEKMGIIRNLLRSGENSVVR